MSRPFRAFERATAAAVIVLSGAFPARADRAIDELGFQRTKMDAWQALRHHSP